ncbi:MAG TPA: HlyD family efflux transporter periplasmic adaptor subunit [Gemmataceae bacterium]|jgi:multidrug resistance efflux pump
MEPSRPSASPPPRRWRLTIPISLGVILLLASLVIAAVSLHTHAGDRSTSPPPAATASPSADENRWMSLGYVDIEGGVTPLYPLQQGRVKRVIAKENEPVKEGDPLFELEDIVPTLKVREAKADLNAAKERLAQAEARVKVIDQQIAAQKEAVEAAQIKVKRARILLERKKRLQKIDDAVAEEVQDAELQVEEAKVGVKGEERKLAAYQAGRRPAEGDVKRAGEDIEAKEAQLEEAQNAVKECVVRAPADGTPLRILVGVGQALGANAHQPAVQFAAATPLLVRAEVEQEFVGRVRKGESVLIQDHITGQDCARGKVVRIARWYTNRRTNTPDMFAAGSDTRTLECIIKIDSILQEVRIGQRVRVQFPD